MISLKNGGWMAHGTGIFSALLFLLAGFHGDWLLMIMFFGFMIASAMGERICDWIAGPDDQS